MSSENAVRFARWVFFLAGIVGVAEIVPLYFLEATLAAASLRLSIILSSIMASSAWFWRGRSLSSSSPAIQQRYVALMPAVFLEKLLYPAAVFMLYAQGRVHPQTLGGAALDLVWLALFVAVWLRLR